MAQTVRLAAEPVPDLSVVVPILNEERSIDEDDQLRAQYWEQIPVTLVDGRPHDFWRVSEDRLRAALTRPAPRAE